MGSPGHPPWLSCSSWAFMKDCRHRLGTTLSMSKFGGMSERLLAKLTKWNYITSFFYCLSVFFHLIKQIIKSAYKCVIVSLFFGGSYWWVHFPRSVPSCQSFVDCGNKNNAAGTEMCEYLQSVEGRHYWEEKEISAVLKSVKLHEWNILHPARLKWARLKKHTICFFSSCDFIWYNSIFSYFCIMFSFNTLKTWCFFSSACWDILFL